LQILKIFDDFLKIFSRNILRIFQIKQLFLSNQVGGCWSFYCEHTPILVFGKRLSVLQEEKNGFCHSG
jgi:hypothetical protein